MTQKFENSVHEVAKWRKLKSHSGTQWRIRETQKNDSGYAKIFKSKKTKLICYFALGWLLNWGFCKMFLGGI